MAAYCNQCCLHLFGRLTQSEFRNLPDGTEVVCERCGPTRIDPHGNCRGPCLCGPNHLTDPVQDRPAGA